MAESDPITITVNAAEAQEADLDGIPSASTFVTDGGREVSGDGE